jgi:hypothetical protein
MQPSRMRTIKSYLLLLPLLFFGFLLSSDPGSGLLSFKQFASPAPFFVTLGPSGGFGGQRFSHERMIASDESQIAAITVRSGRYVDGFRFVTFFPDGITLPSPWYGGTGGTEHQPFTFQGRLTSITGSYGQTVNQLQFHTDTKEHSPLYGTVPGRVTFDYQVPPGCEIIGFHGQASQWLDAIGVVVRCF